MRTFRVGVGLIIWVSLFALSGFWMRSPEFPLRDGGATLARDLWQFASARRRPVALQVDDAVWIDVGDPIYVIHEDGRIKQVGEILEVHSSSAGEQSVLGGSPRKARAMFYPCAPRLGPEYELIGYVTPRSLDWVLKTMLPPEKRAAIAREIALAYEAYHAEILDALKPVALAGAREVAGVVQQQLRIALAAHHDELERLGKQYQQTVLEKELLPLIRVEIWPTVKKHTEPLANDIGREIWARASLWRFGWRYVYDKSPLPEKNLTRAEWNRFVENDVIPVLREHSEQFIAVQREILVDIVENEKVRQTIRDNIRRVVNDEEFRRVVWNVVRDAIIDNQQVHDAVQRQWQSREAQEVVRITSARIESCVRRIGDLLFGTREDGIAPEFAQVLRNQILDKDCRWFVLQQRPDTAAVAGAGIDGLVLPVHRGANPQVNPFAVTLHGARQ